MALVYLARDTRHERFVALKTLLPEIAITLGRERFLREIKLAARLQHPNILPVYDSGDAGGTLYYVMPFVEGESLRDRLEREPQLPVDDALQITREVAEALGYAHDHDVVHRDIKPENIMLSGGHAIVTDFGIARAVSAASTGHVSRITAARRPPRAPWRRPIPVVTGIVLIAALAWLLLERRGGGSTRSDLGGLDRNRVAVLYFNDESHDSSLGFLADGLTEALIDQLHGIRALDVVSRSGVAPFRGRDIARDSIARTLAAGTLVEGDVENLGSRVRVTVRLIDGPSGADIR